MDFFYLFEPYENLVSKADHAFQRMESEFSDCIKCVRHCSDCCHAVFGLFLIEALFLKHDFDQLGEKERAAALKRGCEAEKAIEALQRTLKAFENDPQMKAYSLVKARVRCPLLAENDECILYPFRPITCRVYGIPTMVQGLPRVCGKAGFKKEESYPAYHLDGVHKELYHLSKELLKRSGERNLERASLLLSVPKIIKTPLEELMSKNSVEPDEPS